MLKLDEAKRKMITTIGNESRLKILLALWKADQELTIYKLCRFTGLGRSSMVRHIYNLVESGLVSKKLYGETALYTINRDSSRLNALIEFFRKARL